MSIKHQGTQRISHYENSSETSRLSAFVAKKMMRKVIVILFIFISAKAFCDDQLAIRVFAHLKVNVVSFVIENSSYKIFGDDSLLATVNRYTVFKLTMQNDSILLKTFETNYGKFKKINFTAVNDSGEVKLKLIEPERKPRIYQNSFVVLSEEGALKLLNIVKLDNYIGGVVEAESGTRSTPEFYKIQALLARTFALAHINKHVLEGFSLCDQVHCQAYYGKPKYMEIFKALEDTKGKVVVDENLSLIVAAFHSNSGGQTANSEDVWGTRTSYLRTVVDSFSVKMPNYRWERKMPVDDWLSYLKLKHNYPIEEPIAKEIALNFRQDTRKIFLEASGVKVPLKNVRADLQLKSTFFHITSANDTVFFRGKGYGHGLGMSQEGAMKMTKMGYSYNDVLNFYYRNIQIIDMQKLNFFRDE